LAISGDTNVRYIESAIAHAAGYFEYRFVGIQPSCSCDTFALLVLKRENAIGFLSVATPAAGCSHEYHG
jgi:hypothetical protein